jgi:hypothetical protein
MGFLRNKAENVQLQPKNNHNPPKKKSPKRGPKREIVKNVQSIIKDLLRYKELVQRVRMKRDEYYAK